MLLNVPSYIDVLPDQESFSAHNKRQSWRHQIETFSSLLGFFDAHHKGQWRGALMSSLICTWVNGWVNNWDAGDSRRHCTHCAVIVMQG